MPPYPGLRHSMEVQVETRKGKVNTHDETEEDWATQYQAYLDEQEALGNEEENDAEVMAKEDDEGHVEEDWAVQYAAYCEEKERDFFEANKTKEG